MTLKEKEKIAIDRLRLYEPDEPYGDPHQLSFFDDL